MERFRPRMEKEDQGQAADQMSMQLLSAGWSCGVSRAVSIGHYHRWPGNGTLGGTEQMLLCKDCAILHT